MDFATVVIVIIALAITGLLVFGWVRRVNKLPEKSTAPDALTSHAQPSKKEVLATSDKQEDLPKKTESKAEPEVSTEDLSTPDEAVASKQEEAAVDDGEVKEPASSEEPEKPATISIVPEKTPEQVHEEEIASLREGLSSTRSGFISRLAKIFQGKKKIDASLLEEIEEVLITADIGVQTTEKILTQLRTQMENGELSDEEGVWNSIHAQALEILSSVEPGVSLENDPSVIIVVGVNGVGKTTTIGKLANLYKSRGKKVLLAAGDTFRAAAVLQLEVWGRRVGCPVTKGNENADPSSVIFDAIKKAKNEGFDLVIADTAGRLHTKVPLMDELKKVCRTVTKALDGRDADEMLLVLDSTIGQNAIQQVQIFREALAVNGIALTKLDGTAKGGVILGVVDEHQIPVQYIGLGERVEDLREFDAQSFVDALFSRSNDSTMVA